MKDVQLEEEEDTAMPCAQNQAYVKISCFLETDGARVSVVMDSLLSSRDLVYCLWSLQSSMDFKCFFLSIKWSNNFFFYETMHIYIKILHCP